MIIIFWMIIPQPYDGTLFFFFLSVSNTIITEASFPYNVKIAFTSI